MAEPRRSDPVTRAAHTRLVELICRKLPADHLCMLIGGGSMMEAGVRHVMTTKDEDVVLLAVHDRALKVADVRAVEALIRALGSAPTVRQDQTSVACEISTAEGTFLVEFVRGRRGGHGYFVSRAVLEATAALSRRDDRKLVPPLEALAFLKAWAAVDKAKLVQTGRDARGYHATRERAFRVDVAEIRAQILRSRQPDHRVFEKLLAACSSGRAKAVMDALREAGWEV